MGVLGTSATDDANARKASVKNTEVIRLMLRQQKKDCEALHHNPLFREFRVQQTKIRKFGKGYVAESQAPAIDDIEAEGQQRLFSVIQQAADFNDKALKGVWAAFGKPYVCLGELDPAPGTLPELFKDEQDGARRTTTPRKRPMTHLNQAATAPTAAARSSDDVAAATKSGDGVGCTEEELKLKAHRTILRFTTEDRAEVKFPAAPLKQSELRRARAKVPAHSFVSRREAEHEAEDPTVAYGLVVLPRQQPAAPAIPSKPPERVSPVPGWHESEDGLIRFSDLGDRPAAASEGSHNMSADGTGKSSQDVPPSFRPIVEPAIPPLGNQENPNYKWHNHFLKTRQVGRERLQTALWERAEGRKKVRSAQPLVGNLSTLLMADLDTTRGRCQGHAVAGCSPPNPYQKAEQYGAMVALASRRKPAGISSLDPEELNIVQRFFDQLCTLVEQQRMGDPLSLMVAQKTKTLLESGVFLHKPLLVQVMEHVASFVKGCGLIKYNRYILPLFTFIRKCVGVSEQEFYILSEDMGLTPVIFETPPVLPPPPAPVQLQRPSVAGHVHYGTDTGPGTPTAARQSIAHINTRKSFQPIGDNQSEG